MDRNVVGYDKLIRIILGVALVALALLVPGAKWAWLGLVPLASAAFGYCPLYQLLRIDYRLHS
ncbi:MULTISPECIES: YgaP family membrane protein [Novosphingobium]|uniref:YgaP family membrane protein n=1 Tax=Novosphingobium TaxID=165696 RepID=UPI001CD1AA81|nr:DUF2892 domain-containing protein [Novosphingobium percolationis]MCH7628962.1 DUF2892 domain-containing protein [Pseudomonadota bacterium]